MSRRFHVRYSGTVIRRLPVGSKLVLSPRHGTVSIRPTWWRRMLGGKPHVVKVTNRDA